MIELDLRVERYGKGDAKSLCDALVGLAEYDNDFNGENGVNYLHECVWKANGFKNELEFYNLHLPYSEYNEHLKYKSNLEYYIAKAKESLLEGKGDAEVIDDFLFAWLDNAYGVNYDYNVTSVADTNVISLAIVTDY